MKLYPHQLDALEKVRNVQSCAFYLDMGLGKTYVGSEKAMSIGYSILVICQKSKVKDWIDHFTENYDIPTHDLTKPKGYNDFVWDLCCHKKCVGIINYELIWRRPDITDYLREFTLMLDESSMIQNYSAKQTKFIVHKLHPKATILLSGTPTDGKYERLWTQMKLLGWKISKSAYEDRYVNYVKIDYGTGFKIPVVTGYKNVDELKEEMRKHGCVFMKTEEAFELPEQIEQVHKVPTPKGYKKFMKNRVVMLEGQELIGDTSLTMRLHARQICGEFSKEKVAALKDILDSTSGRVIIFYNFYAELYQLMDITDRPISVVNGKERDLTAYEEHEDSVTFIQYQAGARGLNLQKANHIIYYTLSESSELFEQSKKRIHRIGQDKTCFYHILQCENTIEEKMLDVLRMRKDLTDALFKEWVKWEEVEYGKAK